MCCSLGATVKAIPVNQQGLLDLSILSANSCPEAAMICTMAANNETGVKQDLAKPWKLVIREVESGRALDGGLCTGAWQNAAGYCQYQHRLRTF